MAKKKETKEEDCPVMTGCTPDDSVDKLEESVLGVTKKLIKLSSSIDEIKCRLGRDNFSCSFRIP